MSVVLKNVSSEKSFFAFSMPFNFLLKLDLIFQVLTTEENKALLWCVMLIWLGVGLFIICCSWRAQKILIPLVSLSLISCRLRAPLSSPQKESVLQLIQLNSCYTGFLFGMMTRGRGQEACYYLWLNLNLLLEVCPSKVFLSLPSLSEARKLVVAGIKECPSPMWGKALVTENTPGKIHNDCSSPPPARASRASFSTFSTFTSSCF